MKVSSCSHTGASVAGKLARVSAIRSPTPAAVAVALSLSLPNTPEQNSDARAERSKHLLKALSQTDAPVHKNRYSRAARAFLQFVRPHLRRALDKRALG